MIDPTRFDVARQWLGKRWLLAEPINKLRTARVHAPAENRGKELNQQIARMLAGSEHV